MESQDDSSHSHELKMRYNEEYNHSLPHKFEFESRTPVSFGRSKSPIDCSLFPTPPLETAQDKLCNSVIPVITVLPEREGSCSTPKELMSPRLLSPPPRPSKHGTPSTSSNTLLHPQPTLKSVELLDLMMKFEFRPALLDRIAKCSSAKVPNRRPKPNLQRTETIHNFRPKSSSSMDPMDFKTKRHSLELENRSNMEIDQMSASFASGPPIEVENNSYLFKSKENVEENANLIAQELAVELGPEISVKYKIGYEDIHRQHFDTLPANSKGTPKYPESVVPRSFLHDIEVDASAGVGIFHQAKFSKLATNKAVKPFEARPIQRGGGEWIDKRYDPYDIVTAGHGKRIPNRPKRSRSSITGAASLNIKVSSPSISAPAEKKQSLPPCSSSNYVDQNREDITILNCTLERQIGTNQSSIPIAYVQTISHHINSTRQYSMSNPDFHQKQRNRTEEVYEDVGCDSIATVEETELYQTYFPPPVPNPTPSPTHSDYPLVSMESQIVQSNNLYDNSVQSGFERQVPSLQMTFTRTDIEQRIPTPSFASNLPPMRLW